MNRALTLHWRSPRGSGRARRASTTSPATEYVFQPAATVETALVCLEIYRRDGAGRLRAVGQGYDDGLAGLARDYGVDIA